VMKKMNRYDINNGLIRVPDIRSKLEMNPLLYRNLNH
jgi:hypothetical protein